jgi:hypothetical protein
MKPKENSDLRESRLRREAREAKAVADRLKKSVRTATAKRRLTNVAGANCYTESLLATLDERTTIVSAVGI